VEFVLERATDAAANDVRDRVSRVRGQLPDEVDEPIIAKVEADAQAILWLRLYSDRHPALEISDYADRFVVDRLKTLSGVASVIIGGERRYAMRIWLDRERLAAYGLTPQDVEDALRRQNVEVPSGRIESVQREFTVLSESDLRTPEEFNRIIVREVNGYAVRLRDVGRAELGPQDERNRLRVNGRQAVGMGVVKQSTANTLSVARAVKAELPRLQAALPPGMNLDVAFDTSVFIEKSIESVYEVMAEALLLVVLVIFFFMRSLRATLIPFVTIPVSLIGAFFLVWMMGFTINVLTLLGIVLAIGLVVDDAIVVLENIHRHIEEGMSPLNAAITGSREIAFAVVAMTVTLAAVFAPLAFSTGNTGRLFMEFALTVASAVVVSGFVALTLTPMMCSKLLRHHSAHGRVYNTLEGWFASMSSGYRRTLAACLRRRLVVIGVFAAVAAIGGAVFATLKSELSPLEDRGFFLGLMVAPEGATMDYTDGYARIWESIYKDVPEILTYFVSVAPGLDRPNPVNFAISFMRLKDWSERDRKTQEITAALQPKMVATMPGVIASLINPPSLGQSFRNPPVQFVVQGNSYEQLDRVVNELINKARAYPGFAYIDSDLKLNKPQLSVDINREKAAALGVQVEAIGRTLETLLGGRQVTRF
jgi:multidrug efflux pump